jgi:NAD dependent epimerase/dehydratase family enzyme
LPKRSSFFLSHKDVSGSINLCSPNPLRNKDLGDAIGKVLQRPLFIPILGFMIRLILGEFGDVLLKGQRVIPQRLLEAKRQSMMFFSSIIVIWRAYMLAAARGGLAET